MSGFKTDEFPEKEYKGSLQSDFVNISVVWLRITGDCAHDLKWNMKRHHHSFYELHVALEGFVRMEVDGHETRLEKGNCLLLPSKCPHSFLEISPEYKEFVAGFYLDFSEIGFDGGYIRNAMKDVVPWKPIASSQPLRQYMEDCIRQMHSQPYLPTGVALNICLLLLELSRQVMPSSEGLQVNEESLVSDIRYYIASNLSKGITTETVAAYAHISARHLNRILQTQAQKSVNDLIMEEKMAYIHRLLKTTDMTLEHIAQLSGFTNAYNMSRAFKNREGMPPGEYRKSLHKK